MISPKSGTMMNKVASGACLDFVRDCVFEKPVGYQTREVCPLCRATHEKSLSIQVSDDNVYFRCYRAGCGWKGSIHKNFASRSSGCVIPPLPKNNPFKYRTELLPTPVKEFVKQKYHIGPLVLAEAGVRWAPGVDSLVFPIRNLTGFLSGHSTKRLTPQHSGPKTGLYYDDARPEYYSPFEQIPWKFNDLMTTLRGQPAPALYIVEDCISCLRLVQEGKYCVALLGHHMSERVALELANCFRRLVICLDPDAAAHAAEMAKATRLLFDSVTIKVPPRDPKDLAPDELRTLLHD
jgi:DNA primase